MFRLLLVLGLLASISSMGQGTTPYDSVLAKKLGADDYGMKRYVVVFLKRGPKPITDSVERQRILAAHLKNIGLLASEGKLLVAGPFLDNSNLAGIFILNVATAEEARTLVNSDPAVQAGLFDMELHPWYG